MAKSKLFPYFKTLGLMVLAVVATSCQGVALLDPQGPVGHQTRDLLLISVALGFLVVVPVIAMTIWFAVRYRQSNTKASYKPHWDNSVKIEVLVWVIPIIIITVLSYLTWVKTIDLDPYKPIPGSQPPVRVQVISLDWNWLFIYPDQNIASINKLVIPAGAPITFDMTSATVMTSFFIPELGSQIYVMAGMESHLNLLADRPGTYTGRNLNFSGDGYAKMNFPTESVSPERFQAWTEEAKASPVSLNQQTFEQLRKPQIGHPATVYSSVEPSLFRNLIAEFMKDRHLESKGHGEAAASNEEQH